MSIKRFVIVQWFVLFFIVLSVQARAGAQQLAESESIDKRIAALHVLLSKEQTPDAVRDFVNANFRIQDAEGSIKFMTEIIGRFHGASLSRTQLLTKDHQWSRGFMASGAPAGEPAYLVVSFGEKPPHYIRRIESTVPHSEPGASIRGYWADHGIPDPLTPQNMTDAQVAATVRRTPHSAPATAAELALWRKSVEQTMAEGFENGQFYGSAIILAGEEVIFEGAYGLADVETGEKNTVDTRFRLCSNTKLFTQVAILQLIEEGKLELDGKVSTYRPGFLENLGSKITIRQLLQMRSGLPNELSPDMAASGVEFDEHGMAGPFIDSLTDADIGFAYAPGTDSMYSNFGYWLLGAIIEAVTDKPYADVIADSVFRPLGMDNSGFGQDEVGLPGYAAGHQPGIDESVERVPEITISRRYSSGGLDSSARDMVKFMKSFSSGKILTEQSLGLMFTNFGFPGHATTKTGGPKVSFFGHVPGFYTATTHHINEGYVVVFLNNYELADPRESVGRVLGIIRMMRGDEKIETQSERQ